jgi:hypothetical protein
MADPSSDDRIQSKGREANDAQPLNAADDNGGPERYPSARKDDAVESIEPKTPNPQPRQGAGDSSVNEGRLGPGADPVEGKR